MWLIERMGADFSETIRKNQPNSPHPRSIRLLSDKLLVSALNLRLPDSLHGQVRELAQKDQVSINQFITIAVAEKVATLMTLDYIPHSLIDENSALL